MPLSHILIVRSFGHSLSLCLCVGLPEFIVTGRSGYHWTQWTQTPSTKPHDTPSWVSTSTTSQGTFEEIQNTLEPYTVARFSNQTDMISTHLFNPTCIIQPSQSVSTATPACLASSSREPHGTGIWECAGLFLFSAPWFWSNSHPPLWQV